MDAQGEARYRNRIDESRRRIDESAAAVAESQRLLQRLFENARLMRVRLDSFEEQLNAWRAVDP